MIGQSLTNKPDNAYINLGLSLFAMLGYSMAVGIILTSTSFGKISLITFVPLFFGMVFHGLTFLEVYASKSLKYFNNVKTVSEMKSFIENLKRRTPVIQ